MSKIVHISTAKMSREEWLAYRHTGIGASEVGAILGLDDYMSSLELFYYKIGDVARFDVESMASFMGRESEDLIAKLWQYWDGSEESMIMNFRAGKVVRRCRRVNAFVKNLDYPWLYVNLDREIVRYDERGPGTLELKTISGFESDKWEAGLPPKHITQVQTQMLVKDWTWGEMAIMRDGRRFDVLPFDRRDSIVEAIVTRTHNFWLNVVAARKLVTEKYAAIISYNQRRVDELDEQIMKLAPEPDGTLAYAEYLSEKFNKASLAERRGTVEEEEWAVAHRGVVEQLKDIEENKITYENRLKHAMADHQVLDFGASGKVYWTKSKDGNRIFRNKIKVA